MDADAIDDALDVLRDALGWELSAQRWAAVDDAVRALSTALTERDVRRSRRAVADLELAGPTRAVSAADPPREPVPGRVRERIAELVHALDPAEPDDGQDAGGRTDPAG